MRTESAVFERYQWLVQQVSHYEDLYRRGESPISDEMFDSLVAELSELEITCPKLKPLSGTPQRQSWSLERTFEEKDVVAFDSEVRRRLGFSGPVEYVVEPKIDGWSLHVLYNDSHLVDVSTRGSQSSSRDLVSALLEYSALPPKLRTVPYREKGRLEFRAEAIVPTESFEALNQVRRSKGQRAFRTPFSCIRHLLSEVDAKAVPSPLEVHFHEVLKSDIPLPETYCAQMDLIEDFGLKPVPSRLRCLGIDQALSAYTCLRADRDRFAYEMDGVVIKVDRIEWQHRLGVKTVEEAGREKRLPKWALAYKFPYRGELGVVVRFVATQVPRSQELLELEVLLDGVSEPVRAEIDPGAHLTLGDIFAGDTVRLRRPLGRMAQIMAIEARSDLYRDLRGVCFAIPDGLYTLPSAVIEYIIRSRGAVLVDTEAGGIDYLVTNTPLLYLGTPDQDLQSAELLSEGELRVMLGLDSLRREDEH